MLLLLTGRYAKLVLVENAALGRLQVKTKKNKKKPASLTRSTVLIIDINRN